MTPEVWAGVECTVNRVGDDVIDQLLLTGHHGRLGDLDRIAGLGVTAVRYPVLWERVAPDGLARADWGWTDERLGRLAELGVEAIVGLVHHGSGPRGTSLVDPAFPAGLAAFARAVAERYPHVRRFTPVNEPLTTARFSCLYGHWHPHRRDDLSFARALVTQVRATRLAMDAIREVTPGAELVQTEDLGATWSTPPLRGQAEWENDRRWWSLDLLFGRVAPGTVAWCWLTRAGLAAADLELLAAEPCPPDVVGINHYLSSERWLDHRLDRYPPATHGGNGSRRYADLAAATVAGAPLAGPERLLAAAWERYGAPVAVTEAHNACTREEQLRWLAEVWRGACRLRSRGADVRAVTVWSLFGATGWADLARSACGYEPGAFDVRGTEPRPTAVARMTRALAVDGAFDHPVLAGDGWWHRPDAKWFGALARTGVRLPALRGAPLLVTGASGTLGQAVIRACRARGLNARGLTRSDVDVADAAAVEAVLARHRPWAVVNAAGYVRVDEAEHDRARCTRENTLASGVLAAATARHGVQLATFSSDLVFDGAKAVPYVESDAPRPLQHYGASKHAGEEAALAANPAALVVRTSAFFGPWDGHNFVTLGLEQAARTGTWTAHAGEVVSPTYVPDLVDAVLDLLIDGERGLWHVAGPDAVSWAALARLALRVDGGDEGAVVELAEPGAAGRHARRRPARRPVYSPLGSERATLLRPLEDALERYRWARRNAASAA